MAYWYAAMRKASWRGRVVIAAAMLAVVLVAAVLVALLAGLFMILIGHVVGGLALFGGSVLAAGAGVTIAAKVGVRHLRSLVRQMADTQTAGAQAADPRAADPRVVRLGEGEYRIS